MSDESAASFADFESVQREGRERIGGEIVRTISLPWLSDADSSRMVARFRRIAAETALAPLGETSFVDLVTPYPDAGRRDFAVVNGRGAALYSYAHWVGGAPGDALLQRFVLLLEDGASVDVTVVDSCTQDTIAFLLRGASEERVAQLTFAIEEALRETPSVAPDGLKR